MTTLELRNSRFVEIVRRLSGADDIHALLEEIASAAIEIVGADGCTVWLLNPINDMLVHEIAITRSLKLWSRHEESGGSLDIPINAPAFASAVSRGLVPLRVPDIYKSDYPTTSAQRFDVIYNYRTRSLMGAPILDHEQRLIGVIQAVNSADETGFDVTNETMLAALASCAGIAIIAHRRMESSRGLFRSMVQVIKRAIEISSPYVAEHSWRLPRLVDRLAETMDRKGYAGFALNASRREVLWLASMLHDCGLLAIHDAVLQKRTRLQFVGDRIDIIQCRAALIEANIACAQAREWLDAAAAERHVVSLREMVHWLTIINEGTATLTEADVRRLREIAAVRFPGADGQPGNVPVINADELTALSTLVGVLSETEKTEIRRHVEHSVSLLNEIPWPRDLAEVPAIVACHHERLDGSGYPNGIRELPLLARMLSMCDAFDGIMAPRKYGRRKQTVEEAVAIMEAMARDGKIDPDLWRFFIANGLHLVDALSNPGNDYPHTAATWQKGAA